MSNPNRTQPRSRDGKFAETKKPPPSAPTDTPKAQFEAGIRDRVEDVLNSEVVADALAEYRAFCESEVSASFDRIQQNAGALKDGLTGSVIGDIRRDVDCMSGYLEEIERFEDYAPRNLPSSTPVVSRSVVESALAHHIATHEEEPEKVASARVARDTLHEAWGLPL